MAGCQGNIFFSVDAMKHEKNWTGLTGSDLENDYF